MYKMRRCGWSVEIYYLEAHPWICYCSSIYVPLNFGRSSFVSRIILKKKDSNRYMISHPFRSTICRSDCYQRRRFTDGYTGIGYIRWLLSISVDNMRQCSYIGILVGTRTNLASYIVRCVSVYIWRRDRGMFKPVFFLSFSFLMEGERLKKQISLRGWKGEKEAQT